MIDVAIPPDSNIRKEGAQEKKEVPTAEGTTGADMEGKVPAVIGVLGGATFKLEEWLQQIQGITKVQIPQK